MIIQERYRPVSPGAAWVISNLDVVSAYGRSEVHALKPNESAACLENCFREIVLTSEILKKQTSLSGEMKAIFRTIRDIRGTITSLENDFILDETELFEIKQFAMNSQRLRALCDSSALMPKFGQLHSLEGVISLLNPDQTVIPSFYLHESYSEQLTQIRTAKLKLEALILSENDPQTKESLRQQRAEIVAVENEEEFKVRSILSQKLKTYAAELSANAIVIGRLELLLAKTEMANRWPSCQPQIFHQNEATAIRIKNAINPEIVEILKTCGKSFTPVTIDLKRGITMLTGANMGGKTVALMTAAMNIELAMLGFFAFAEEISMPALDFISINGGDGQNHQAGLSSFGAEMIALNDLAPKIRSGCGLAIFDEFARSTNPFEGRRFVQALCDYLGKSGSFGIVATHYDGICLNGSDHYQVVGLRRRFAEKQSDCLDRQHALRHLCESMDYHITKISGPYEVPKDAFNIAVLLETDSEFLDILRKHYNESP
jgi:dsDNA-specific endonuclease/ATPase MutS2